MKITANVRVGNLTTTNATPITSTHPIGHLAQSNATATTATTQLGNLTPPNSLKIGTSFKRLEPITFNSVKTTVRFKLLAPVTFNATATTATTQLGNLTPPNSLKIGTSFKRLKPITLNAIKPSRPDIKLGKTNVLNGLKTNTHFIFGVQNYIAFELLATMEILPLHGLIPIPKPSLNRIKTLTKVNQIKKKAKHRPLTETEAVAILLETADQQIIQEFINLHREYHE